MVTNVFPLVTLWTFEAGFASAGKIRTSIRFSAIQTPITSVNTRVLPQRTCWSNKALISAKTHCCSAIVSHLTLSPVFTRIVTTKFDRHATTITLPAIVAVTPVTALTRDFYTVTICAFWSISDRHSAKVDSFGTRIWLRYGSVMAVVEIANTVWFDFFSRLVEVLNQRFANAVSTVYVSTNRFRV